MYWFVLFQPENESMQRQLESVELCQAIAQKFPKALLLQI